MDRTDSNILRLLAANARMPAADIARKINLSLPAVTERIRKLERTGFIKKYTVQLNRPQFDLHLLAIIQLWIDHSKSAAVKEQILSLNEVLECHHVAGEYDLLLKVLVKDTTALENLLAKKIKSIKAVTRTSTTIILSTYKEELNVNNFQYEHS